MEAGVTLDHLVYRGDTGRPIRFKVWFEHDDPKGKPGYALEVMKGRTGWSVTEEEIRIASHVIRIDEDSPFVHPTERLDDQSVTVPARGTLRAMVNRFVRDEKALTALEPILENSRRLGEVWRYRPSALDIATFTPTERLQEGKASDARERRPYVLPNGRGLAPTLQDLLGRQRDVFEKVEGKVRDMFKHIRTIGFEASHDGVRLSFMTTRSNNLIPAPQESDGVLLAIFLCWRLYTAAPPITICLEEPENGFYPELLDARYQLLRSFTNPPDGSPGAAQILVSTHSIEFLRVLKQHHSDFANVRAVGFVGQSEDSCVESVGGYHDAANLIEHVLNGDSPLPSTWER